MRYLTLFLVLIISACSTNDKSVLDTRATDQDIYEKYASKCTYTDGKTPAPEWICGYPIDEYNVTEVGFSRRGIEEEAKAIALSKLAGRILTQVKTNITADIDGKGKTERREFTSRSIQTIEQSLVNTRVLLRQIDPLTKGLYVLVIAEDGAYENAINSAQIDLNR